MKILLTGLVSVHWGRVENGNIGNYYIVETTIRELHRVFPSAEILTTFQMTDEFCMKENVTVLPLDIYYSWSDNDLTNALKDFAIAGLYNKHGVLVEKTGYLEVVSNCDLVCDFSGEMWGDHAEPVGNNRFLINLLKMRAAQLIGKPTVLLAGSQGPFNNTILFKSLAQEVLENFTIVVNREAASRELLADNGFNVTNVFSYTDPAFLFEPAPQSEIEDLLKKDNIISPSKKTIGFILCGFNMLEGPYDKEPREDNEFSQFVELIEYIVNELDARVFLMSHQNGFIKEPTLKLINGRDFPYADRLHQLIKQRNKININDVICQKGPYTPKETKAIINNFDMFVSGRIHAFVAAVSQCVPTVIINRGHGGRSHRNIGFARSVGLQDYISDPSSIDDMKAKVKSCWENKEQLRVILQERIPSVKEKAHQLFDSLKGVIKNK